MVGHDEGTSVFARVRTACRAVSKSAEAVRIDRASLERFADRFASEPANAPVRDEGAAKQDSGGSDAAETTAALTICLDAINFGSGYFPHLRKLPGLSGSRTIAVKLSAHVSDHGPISARRLATITARDCARLFDQNPEDPDASELMSLYARAWNDLGRDLLRHHGARFLDLVENAGGSADRLVRLLCRQQPFFRDVSRYGGLDVPFYKRAQILASDLHLAFGGEGPGRFEDIGQLTMFADNLVPHVLRIEGVLRYRPELVSRIKRGELIPHGAPEEVELRSCAVHAVELLVDALRRRGTEITPREIDMRLWHRGQLPLFKAAPRHRTRCVYY